jgi:tetratricopeptide (TPR) repeat protein
MNVRRIGAAVVWVAAAVTGAAAAADTKAAAVKPAGAIEFSTKSAEARTAAVETIRLIETFQGGAKGLAAAQKAVAADPEFAFGHFLVGPNSPQAAAKASFDKAAELAPKASEGERRYMEAHALNRAQKRVEALDAFRKLAADYPRDRMVQMMIGQLAMGEGRFDEARTAFDRAAAIDRSTPRVHALMGNVFTLQDDYARAREYYQYAMERQAPGTASAQAQTNLAFSYVYEGQPDQALTALRSYLEAFRKTGGLPGLPEVFIWNAMGRIELENGRLPQAMADYEKGFESVPASDASERDKKLWLGRLHHGRGRTLARMGKYDEAWKEAELLRKLIEENGEEGKEFLPAYHYLAGYIKMEAGDDAAALEHLKQSDPTDPFNLMLLGKAYEKAGDKEGARKAYQAAMAIRQLNLDRALAYPIAKKRLASL